MERSRRSIHVPLSDYVRRVLIACGIGLTLLALALFAWYSIYVILLMFAGVLLAILLRALADMVSERTRLPHRVSLAIVLVVLAGGLAVALYFGAAALYNEISDLTVRLPEAWRNFRARIEQARIGQLILDNSPPISEMLSTGGILSRFRGVASSTFGLIVALIVISFTGLFIAFDPRLYVRGTLRLLPEPYRVRGGEVLGAIGYTLKWWLIGQAVTMVVIGVATWVGLVALKIPLALALAFLTALFNFIPNFGPLIALVPATLLAMTISPERAIWVIVLFIVLQNLEGNVLTPLIQRRAVSLPPALTIASQTLLGILVGPLGLVLATPLAAAALVATKMIYIEDILGDRIKTPAEGKGVEEVREATEVAEEVTEDAQKSQPKPRTKKPANGARDKDNPR